MKNKKLLCSVCFLFAFMSALWGQNITVKGNVISKTDGEPIIGASVIETTATTNGTITDFDGNFTLTVKKGSELTISYIGFKTIKVGAKALLNVTLEEDSEMLDEVVVTGYSTQKKADLTGSVAVVSTKTLKTATDADPMKSLQGKVPGMTITANGSPSGTGTVRIRGIGSFNSSQDPLYVVDGVPTTRALNSLNTNDIESMQVLKDAASASIYGSRASNGVIIITTKKGKKADKVKVDFSANLTAQFYTPQSLMKLSNTSDYATAMAQAALNDGMDPVAYASNYGLNLNAATGTPITVWNPITGNYVDYTVNGLYDGYINKDKTMRFSDTDWLDEISRTGFSQNYDLSLSHANEKHSTMFSLGYKKNSGILKYTDFENISARMNSSYNVNKYITVGENFTVTYTSQVDCAPMENALKMAPTVPVYEEDGVTFAGPVGGMSDRQNPLRELYDNRDNHLDYWRLFGNGYVELKPVKGLVIRSNFGIDHYSSFINAMTKTFHSDIVNNDIAKTTLSHNNETNWTWSNTANYNFRLADKHDFTVLLGTEMSKQSVIDFSAYSEEYTLEDKDYMWPNAATGTMRNSGAKVGYRLASFFGKVDYNFDDFILASFTIRRDGSSRFGKANRWGVFPAVSAAYRISNEKFWPKDFVMNSLKLRASWGANGNNSIPTNTALAKLSSANYSSGTIINGFAPTSLANPDLGWEKTESWNVAFDMGLFNNRIFISADYYVKTTKDLLYQVTVPALLGFTKAWGNIGSIRNKGFELEVTTQNLTGKLKWSTSLNVSYNQNKVLSLGDDNSTVFTGYDSTTQVFMVGQPLRSFYMYDAVGVYQTQADLQKYPVMQNTKVGDVRYRDANGDGIISDSDRTLMGKPDPDYTFGITNTFKYKNFDLSVLVTAQTGGHIYGVLGRAMDRPGMGANGNVLSHWKNMWKSEAEPGDGKTPGIDNANTGQFYDSRWLYSTDFIKIKNVTLGYRLPLKKKFVQNARVYLSGENLLMWDKYDGGFSPEANNGGSTGDYDYGSYPQARVITLGVNVTF